MKIKGPKFSLTNQTSNKIRKFHRSFNKSRVEILRTNPIEARKALRKMIDCGAYIFSNNNVETMSDENALKLMEDVLRDIARKEKEESK